MSQPQLDLFGLAHELLAELGKDYEKNKKISSSLHVILHNTFGETYFEALDLVDRDSVRRLVSISGRDLVEISSVVSGALYNLLPHINYCTCSTFNSKVLQDRTQLTLAMRVLCVAEKHNAAKRIANILSRNRCTQRNGRSKYNKIFQFTCTLWNQQVDVIFTSVSGHMLNYDFPANFNHWHGVPPSQLFSAPVVRVCPPNSTPVKETLEAEARKCQALIIWTDGDREGENIGFEIIQVCTAVNPQLRLHRARFSEITPTAVQRAMDNLVQPDRRQSEAVDCRSELDLRIGAAFTRLQTLFLQRQFPNRINGDQKLVSYGSCQFPTLGFVVERYKQAQEFVPEPFWKIEVTHNKNNTEVTFNWDRVRLFVREPCQIILDICMENRTATVLSVRSKPTQRYRPKALDTVELEKLANKKLRMSAAQTMRVAEKLYTAGFISYPRTETNKFPNTINLTNLVNNQTIDHQWGPFATDVLQRGVNPNNGNKTDEAHPPIHPTIYANPQQLEGDDRRLYELITRHFLACVSRNATGKETIVQIGIANETFTAKGVIIEDRGFLEVYPYQQWEDKQMPIYTQGETFQPNKLEMAEGRTTAPNLLTEADLITLMEKHGIGTDATHAEHIETIKKRLYVALRNDRRFVPGFLGLGLVEGYDLMGYHMALPFRRAQLEADLKRICDGQRNKDDVLRDQIRSYQEIFEQTERQIDQLTVALRKYWPADGPGGGGGGPGGFQPPPPPPGGGGPQFFPGNGPNCNCGQPARAHTVKKDGPNKGRPMFACAKGRDNGCGFFQWGDEPQNPTVAAQGTQQPTMPVPNCQCGRPARSFTVKKEGPNKGRPIFTCANGSENGCGFFQWGDEVNAANNTMAAPPHSQQPVIPAPNCNCGQPARSCTVKKEGTNKGRPIFTCSIGRENGCNFFQWGDEPQQGADPNANAPFCPCGQPARSCTVKKDGPNKGRGMFVCAKGQAQGCGFFQWAGPVLDTTANF